MKKTLLTLLLIITITFSYTISTFDDGSASKTYNFTEPGSNGTYASVFLPKNSTFKYAYFNLVAQPVANWTNVTYGNGTEPILDVQMFSDSLGYSLGRPPAGSSGGGGTNPFTFFKWNGSNWIFQENFDAVQMKLLSTSFGFAVNESNKIYFYNGSAWKLNATLSPTDVQLYNIDVYNSTLAFAVGGRGALDDAYIYKFNGTGWTQETVPTTTAGYLYGVSFVNSTLAYAVGYDGQILKWNSTNWTQETSPVSDDLYSIDVAWSGATYFRAYAVGEKGHIIYSTDQSAWENVTSPLPETTDFDLYSVDIFYFYKKYAGSWIIKDKAIAVGKNGVIIATPESTASWGNMSSSTSRTLWSVSVSDDDTMFAVGDNMTYIRYYGYPNGVSLGVETTKVWNYTESAEMQTATADFTSFMAANGPYDNDTMPLNLTVGTPAYITISPNFSYGTQLTGVVSGITFNLTSNGSDVTTNPVFENSNVTVYNSSSGTAICKIEINFSVQPDYSGWSASTGINGTDNRAYVIAEPFSDADAPQNITPYKTLYVKFSNTSATKVCLNESYINAANLTSTVTESDCSAIGGTVLTPNTTDINGVTYFVIPNVQYSGAVQIIPNSGSNSPPVLTGSSVSPSSGSTETSFTFTTTVYDADNDAQTPTLTVGGVTYTMSESDSTDTDYTDGKTFTYTTQLPQGNLTYYFSSNDGTTTSRTIDYTLQVTAGEPVTITSAPGFNYPAVILLFLAVSLIYYKLNQ